MRKAKDKSAEIVLLDHGLYEYVPEDVRINLAKLWKSIVLGDRKTMDIYCEKLGVGGKFPLFISPSQVVPECSFEL